MLDDLIDEMTNIVAVSEDWRTVYRGLARAPPILALLDDALVVLV